ncbi:uncharacterized protein AB675_2080 [Cyphellophora attinorum]|uniref:Uncharacterized protein n=1 Tax=Cyphellophora attinorum TaxID=1664694 RepID=A0A0N1HU07_9EURO|nr:uncharacterized protein AB675_2080 [Phialophora attinorum]KPI42714.1 hypothetical protein AB675_2080 [Phialophora attinorum]
MLNIYHLLGVPASGFNSKPFVTSWLLPQYPLALIRLIISVYIVTSISYSYAYFAKHKVTFHLQDIGLKPVTFQVGAEGIRQSFSYFTYESYWSQAFYFFFAALHTFDSARKGNAFLDYWPRPLQAMHSVFYSCVTAFPFLVSAVYWASMYAGPWFDHDFDRWSALSIHGLNSVFALFEVIVTRTKPQPWAHLGILLLIMSLYLGVAYITKYTENIYLYLWLDPNNGIPQLIAHVVGYAMTIVVIFNVVRGAIWFRCSRLREAPPPDASDDHWEAKSMSHVSLFSSQTSTLAAIQESKSLGVHQYADIEKIGEASSANIPLYAQSTKRSSLSSYNDAKSRASTVTIAMPEKFHEASSINIPLPEMPDAVHRADGFPKRNSSYHVRNFSRPTSACTTSPSLKGFWM